MNAMMCFRRSMIHTGLMIAMTVFQEFNQRELLDDCYDCVSGVQSKRVA